MNWNNGTGWHNGMGWGGTGILMILFWGLVIWGIIWLIRSMNTNGQKSPDQTRDHEAMNSSDEILAKRFARGEIGEEEYSRRLAMLRSPQGPGASTDDAQVHRKDRTVA